MISAKQLEANRQNAQHSTGPQTPEGKAVVRFNALKHGLRARTTILPFENPDLFNQLYADLVADWNPQTRTEQLHVEQMAIHQWLLIRLTSFERSVYAGPMDGAAQMAHLERFSPSAPASKIHSPKPCATSLASSNTAPRNPLLPPLNRRSRPNSPCRNFPIFHSCPRPPPVTST